jgi:hypothetical protein
MDPLIPEVAAIVIDQSNLASHLPQLEAGKEPQIHQHLKSIADPEDKPSAIDKPDDLILHPVLETHGHDHPGSMVVSPGKAPAHDKDLIAVKPFLAADEAVEVHPLGFSARNLQRIGRLDIAIQAKSGQNQRFDRAHQYTPDWYGRYKTAVLGTSREKSR